jgi:N-acetylneuraminate synthase
MRVVNIGGRMIGGNNPCFIIAEIGINHNGSVDIAKKLIDVAVESGCDAVKFQKRTIGVVYTSDELAKPRENPFGKTNGDLKRGLEFGLVEYMEIVQYCNDKEIIFLASCWDEESVDFIDRFSPPCYKVASACLTDENLLSHTSSKDKPIILSTGMSTMEEVEYAVDVLDKKNLILLHSVSTYPSENHELNLSVIPMLKEKFLDVPIGYSGHERGIALSVCAVALGACVIERHITLDRTMWGSDQSASLEPVGLSHLVRDIRMFESALGDGEKRVLKSELPIKEKLRRKEFIQS